MTAKIHISLLVIIAIFSSCVRKEKARKKMVVEHYNILVAPDLSNRLEETKPVNDTTILRTIIYHIPEILNSKRDMEQLDKYNVLFINQQWINQYKTDNKKLAINFANFNSQIDRIKYIKNGALASDQHKFVTEFNRINDEAKISNNGADIWTFLNSIVDQNDIANVPNQNTNDMIQQKYRNVLIILTDGYIEAGIYKKGYDLSGRNIKAIRQMFISSHENNFKSYFRNHSEVHIKRLENPVLKDLEILVLELGDRSLSKTGQATVHPTDGEIIKEAWSEWLENSDVKRFELHSEFATSSDAEKTILNFLNVGK